MEKTRKIRSRPLKTKEPNTAKVRGEVTGMGGEVKRLGGGGGGGKEERFPRTLMIIHNSVSYNKFIGVS